MQKETQFRPVTKREVNTALWMFLVGLLMVVFGLLAGALPSALIGVAMTGVTGWQLVKYYRSSPVQFRSRLRGWWTDQTVETDYETATDEPADDPGEIIMDAAGDFLDRTTLTITAVLLTSFMAVFAAWILAYPGGLVRIIAEIMVGYCRAGMTCDFWSLYASVGVAVLIFAEFSVYIFLVLSDSNHDSRQEQWLLHISDQIGAASRMIAENSAGWEMAVQMLVTVDDKINGTDADPLSTPDSQ